MTDLHDLLHDAVDDVEPTDRLNELRARTADPARAAARPWFYAAGVAALATAAAVAVVAVVGDGPGGSGHHHDMAMDPPAPTQLVAAYFLGDGPSGDRLFREFDRVPAGDALSSALQRIQQAPADPDYSTPWRPGSFTGATVDDGVIRVQVGEIDPSVSASDLRVQQVVYTLQAAVGERLPVSFVDDGEDDIGRVGAAAERDVLNPVSISDPAEGNAYSGSMIARGRADVDGGSVHWELQAASRQTVREGLAPTDSGDGFGPWTARVDLSGLPDGTYTFVATSSDLSGGAELSTLDHDTRTITVR